MFAQPHNTNCFFEVGIQQTLLLTLWRNTVVFNRHSDIVQFHVSHNAGGNKYYDISRMKTNNAEQYYPLSGSTRSQGVLLQ